VRWPEPEAARTARSASPSARSEAMQRSSGAITTSPKHSGSTVITRRACWRASWTTPLSSRRRRWIAGVVTSTTGRSATRRVFTCSIARHMLGRRSRPGLLGARNSCGARRSRFSRVFRCTTRHQATRRFSGGSVSWRRPRRDERNFVKKSVNWALRSLGKRNKALHAASVKVAERLARSPKPPARWVGKDALRELTSPPLKKRLARKG